MPHLIIILQDIQNPQKFLKKDQKKKNKRLKKDSRLLIFHYIRFKTPKESTMFSKALTLNFLIVTVMTASAAVGGVMAGLATSGKSYFDLIWLLG